MKLTPRQIAKIQQKDAAIPDAKKRDPNVDYYHGWFFVTLNTRDQVPVLSVCVGKPEIADGESGAPQCMYTQVGKGVMEAWKKMADVSKTIELDLCEAMPEHFHGLVHLLPENKRHLGSLISGFMSGCSHAYWDTLGIEWRKNRDEKVRAKQLGGKRAYARLTPDRDPDHTYSYIGPALFVHGYNDMEPITPADVEVKRAYIRDQARKRLIQGDRHVCFRKYRHQHSPNWTMERVMNAISTDKTFHYNPARCIEAQRKVMARLNTTPDPRTPAQTTHTTPDPRPAAQAIPTTPDGRTEVQAVRIGLDYIGDKALLYSPRKLPLICHRADAPRFEQQKEAVLSAAREGAVIVSAFISGKERDIKTQLMIERLPFIEIMDNGFSEKYKGVGKSFYAFAENRLLQISPWTYLYQKDGVLVSREMCMVMNELARVISGCADDWWMSS